MKKLIIILIIISVFFEISFGQGGSVPQLCLQNSQVGTLCGNSRRSVTRWAFVARENACRSFNYNGCNGNCNNFLSQQTCEFACKGRR
uniref:BPTI/Kunitz inhibitor domain-containing protein n=1 Tax=Meloidogyne incognita TaxID=6306 RepID=A0A914N7D0_MELIC